MGEFGIVYLAKWRNSTGSLISFLEERAHFYLIISYTQVVVKKFFHNNKMSPLELECFRRETNIIMCVKDCSWVMKWSFTH